MYVVNPGYWSFRGTLSLHVSPRNTTIYRVGDDAKLETRLLNLEIPAFGIAAWRSTGCIDVTDYTMSSISPMEMAHMTNIIGLVANHSQSLPQPQQEIASRVSERALRMLAMHEYAAAWSTIKVPEYWTLFQTLKGERQPP